MSDCKASHHGTRSAYRHGCRCPEARVAMRPVWAATRARRRLARGITVRGMPARWVEVDEIAVARAVAGEPPARMSPAEKTAAVLALTDLGMSAKAIGRRLRMCTRQVQRHRSGQIKSYWMSEVA